MEQENIQTNFDLPDLETLKGRLEQQEATKIKAEQIVSTLSRIKAREKASRRKLSTRDDSSVITCNVESKKSHSAPNSAVKEKSNLLKRKLEEDRLKFESKRDTESLDKVNELVQTMKVKLEDRDKLMQQILLHAQQQPQCDVKSGDTSNQMAASQSPEMEPELSDEVKNRIADLEAKIIDLQENLKEKDNVISARTQAITLLSEDMSRKSKTTLDTLEETQEQMKQMQRNFIAIEDKMKKEHQRLKEEAEDRKQRCLQAEKNLRIVENARYDLSTRVAELQEKVASVQTKNIDMEKFVSELETKYNQTKEALETSKNTNVKMKAQFKIKMKALEEERDLLKKMSGEENAVSSLQERILELEEEKGNLQLSLVDFDDLKEQSRLLKERITELDQKLTQQEDDLDSHVKAISKLELEKLDLIQVVQERNSSLLEKDQLINQLQQQLSDVEQLKVSAEMRAIELEEKLDAGVKEKEAIDRINHTDINNLKQQLTNQEETIRELQMKLASGQENFILSQQQFSDGGGDDAKDKDLTKLNSQLEEWKSKYIAMESQYNEINKVYKCLENRLEVAEKQNEQVVIECDRLRSTIADLQTTVTQYANTNAYQNSNTSDTSAVVVSPYNYDDKDIEINRLREELSATTLEIHRLSTAWDNLNITGHKIDELNLQIIEKDKALTDANNELEKRTRKLSEYKKFHKLKSEDVLRVSHELEDLTVTSQHKISQLETEVVELRNKESELQKEIKELKDNQSSSGSNEPSQSDQQNQKIRKLAASIKLKVKYCKELEDKIETYKKSLEEKQKACEELTDRDNKNSHEINQLKIHLAEAQQVNVSSVFQCVSEPNSNVTDPLIENNNLQKLVNDQEKIINELQIELSVAKEEQENAFTELDKLHQSELSKSDELLKSLEIEIADSKNVIQNLQQQLADIVKKYEQTWAKLQEKDAYIENVEDEFRKAQEKMRSIESSSVDMKQNFAQVSSVLEERLRKSEEIKDQFEKYKYDLEQQLVQALEKENYLQKGLHEKENENEELKNLVTERDSLHQQLERENIQLTNHIRNLETNLSTLTSIQEAYNQSLIEVDRLSNELREIKLINERHNLDHVNIKESLTMELNSMIEKCNVITNESTQRKHYVDDLLKQNDVLQEEVEKQKLDFEMKYTFLQGERNQFEALYAKLKSEAEANDHLCELSDVKKKEIDNILMQQRALIESQLEEFRCKEESYIKKIQDLEEYNQKLIESLKVIESNSELLQYEMNKVGAELNASKTELDALRSHQEKTQYIMKEMEIVKVQCCRSLEEEKELNESLKMELLREKAKREVDTVVDKAKLKVEIMTQTQPEEYPPLFKFNNSKLDVKDFETSFDNFPKNTAVMCPNDESNVTMKKEALEELKHQLNWSLQENERLQSVVDMYEQSRHISEKAVQAGGETLGAQRIENKDEEDGWGWGTEEVIVEQDTAVASATEMRHLSNDPVDIRLLQLEKRLKVAEEENSRLTEELKGSQLRCTKLIKKAKELKAKSEDLERGSRERSVGFEDLDFAMQEELRNQIEVLQKNLQESVNENKNWKTEKENYLKKIETLMSGNERLVDMKERQDIELSIFQKQNLDLKQQISGFEWKIEELMEDHERLTANCTDMEEKINSLAAENEQLIKIVGDMKDQQKINDNNTFQAIAQTSPSTQHQIPLNVPPAVCTFFRDDVTSGKSTDATNSYNDLLQKYQQLKEEYDKTVITNNGLKENINSINIKINDVEKEKLALKCKLENIDIASGNIEEEYNTLIKRYNLLDNELKNNKEQLKEYKTRCEHLEELSKSLEESLNNMKISEQELRNLFEKEISTLKNNADKKFSDLYTEYNSVISDFEQITIEKSNLIKEISDLKNTGKDVEKPVLAGTASSLFRGFADDCSTSDLFNLPCGESNKDEHKASTDVLERWDDDSNNLIKQEVSNSVTELKEQVTELHKLLAEKETELEMTKQSIDNIHLATENLQDEWRKKFEDLKAERLSSVNDDTQRIEEYEIALNAAQQQYKDNLILKDEEISCLMCELSSKEQQSINLRKEITELNKTIEKYKTDNELKENELIKLHSECFKLNGNLQELQENENSLKLKLSKTELKFQNFAVHYDESLKIINEENENKIRLQEAYNDCCTNLNETGKLLAEKDKLLQEANNKIDDLSAVINLQKQDQPVGMSVINSNELNDGQQQQNEQLSVSLQESDAESIQNYYNEGSISNDIERYREMIKQRDIEIERLLQVVGEAEERIIKAEEMRLNAEEVKGLKLKLDEALYTVHLRDLRCEELTLELMQLLEERDTLQLRLSTAIRMNEELRGKTTATTLTAAVSSAVGGGEQTTESSSYTTRSSSIEQTTDDVTPYETEDNRLDDKLHEKLGELHTVGYQKDLSLHQDRIKRHNEQMLLYSASSPQQQPLNNSNEEINTSGGFFSWIFGGTGASSNAQVDI